MRVRRAAPKESSSLPDARLRALSSGCLIGHYMSRREQYRSRITELFAAATSLADSDVIAKHAAFEYNGLDDM